MHNLTDTDQAVLDAFKFRLGKANATNEAQHLIFKRSHEDPGMSMNFMVPLAVPPHFLSHDPNLVTLGDKYLTRDEVKHEISELAFDQLSLAAIEEMLQCLEKTTGSEPLFIQPGSSPTSLFISTPQILILMVVEKEQNENSDQVA